MTASRKQAYVFAHQALPEIFFRDPEKFIASLKNEGVTFLSYTWNQVGKYIGEEDLQAGEALAVEVIKEDEFEITLITCPPPTQPTEPYYIAAAYKPPHAGEPPITHFILLELGSNPERGNFTLLAEWYANRHINYGEGPQPEKNAFLNSVKKIIGKIQ